MHDWNLCVPLVMLCVSVCQLITCHCPLIWLQPSFPFPAPTPSHIHHHRGLSCHSSLTPDLSPRPRLGGCCYGNTAAPRPVTADPWSPNGDHNLLPPASLSMNITEKGEMKNKPKQGRVQRIGGLIDGGMDRWMTEQRVSVKAQAFEMSFDDLEMDPLNSLSKWCQLCRGGFAKPAWNSKISPLQRLAFLLFK